MFLDTPANYFIVISLFGFLIYSQYLKRKSDKEIEQYKKSEM